MKIDIVKMDIGWLEQLIFMKNCFESLGDVSSFSRMAADLEAAGQDVVSLVFDNSRDDDTHLYFWCKPMLECGYKPVGKMRCEPSMQGSIRTRYIMARPKNTRVAVYQEGDMFTISAAALTGNTFTFTN